MTMADECDVGKIVTAFLLNTCRLAPRQGQCDIQAATYCGSISTEHPLDDEEAELIPLITGSIGEFYIEPMLPLAGDIDLMFHVSSELTIPRGHPAPTQLPDEFHKYVHVYEIIDSHLRGFVYLQMRYLLTQCSNDGKYNYLEYDEGHCVQNSGNLLSDGWIVHGPALLADNSDTLQLLPMDVVRCLRCLVWPPQAADWPTRHRNYGWPDSATLDRIVSNGCDVVGVAHRQCKQDKWISKLQWRLSFSRAEIVLLNSWMPVQQIVYHMLRYFVKTERLSDCADNSGAGTLSNYHIKTLMLWACELKSRSWWTENLNAVRICVELLNTLSVWLIDKRCPHYFIINCNLLDNSFNVGSVASKLISTNEKYISTWFVNNYIGQCAQLCPQNVSRLSNDVSTTKNIQNVASEIVYWRLNNLPYDSWRAVLFAERYVPEAVSQHSLTVRSCICWMNQFAKIDKRFPIYFSAVALLQVARRISRNGSTDELMDILATILGRNFNQCCSVLSIRKTERNTSELVELLLKSAVEHLTTYRQLEARDFGSIATIVTTDFEALYAYKRGDYQRCLQLSTQNIRTLLNAVLIPPTVPQFQFVQLFDGDVVSLTALMLMVNPECRDETRFTCISQTTLSLYLMTQCQLKLRHPLTSLAQTLDYIDVAQRRHPRDYTLNQLTLKLIERKVLINWSRLRSDLTY